MVLRPMVVQKDLNVVYTYLVKQYKVMVHRPI